MIKKLFTGKHRYVSTLVSAVISFVIIVWLIIKVDVRWDRVKEHWHAADLRYLCLAMVVSAFWHIIIGTDKWYRILRRLGAPVSWREVLMVRVGSDPIRFAAPFKTGELVNIVYFARPGYLDFGRSLSSVLFDKILNFFGTLFWFFLGLAALGANRAVNFPMKGQLGIMLLAGALFFCLLVFEPLRAMLSAIGGAIHPKVSKIFDGGLAPFRIMTLRQKFFFLLYGIFFQLRPLIVIALIFRAYGAHPALNEILTYGSIAVLMSNIPLTQGGIGPREAAVQAFFSGYGDPALLISVGLLLSFSMLIVPAIIGIPLAPRLLRQTVNIFNQQAVETVEKKKTLEAPAVAAASVSKH